MQRIIEGRPNTGKTRELVGLLIESLRLNKDKEHCVILCEETPSTFFNRLAVKEEISIAELLRSELVKNLTVLNPYMEQDDFNPLNENEYFESIIHKSVEDELYLFLDLNRVPFCIQRIFNYSYQPDTLNITLTKSKPILPKDITESDFEHLKFKNQIVDFEKSFNSMNKLFVSSKYEEYIEIFFTQYRNKNFDKIRLGKGFIKIENNIESGRFGIFLHKGVYDGVKCLIVFDINSNELTNFMDAEDKLSFLKEHMIERTHD